MILIQNKPVTLEEHLAKLQDKADFFDCQMAVVDYLGFTYQHLNGRYYTVTEKTPLDDRYDVRSMAHVAVYKFPTLYLNKKAREAQNG